MTLTLCYVCLCDVPGHQEYTISGWTNSDSNQSTSRNPTGSPRSWRQYTNLAQGTHKKHLLYINTSHEQFNHSFSELLVAGEKCLGPNIKK